MIVAENITKYYGAHAAVQGISFTINRGEVVGLLGLNGAGKTTTLRILSGLLVPTSGRIVIDGVDVVAGSEDIRARIGFLPDNPPLYPEMTVESFLRFVARIKGVAERDIAAAVQRALEAADILDKRHDIIETLSHGYRRRVGIAHAIVHSPPLILLDEPTGGLDPVQIVQMRQLIRALASRHTIIVSSHILSEISQLCDRILVLQTGRIVAEGTEEALGRRVAGASSITIEVRGTSAALASALGRVGAVQRHTVAGERDGTVTATVDLTSDAREAVAKAIIDAGMGLRRLDRASLELENIFMQLTGSASQRWRVRNVFWIMRRDLSAYLRSAMGYIVMFGALGLLGLLFNVYAVGTGSTTSADVLSRFFFMASGVMATASVFLAMRLIAEERQLGTLTLLMTSPVRDWQLVLGKFLSAVSLLVILLALSVYMPLLIYLNGKISVAHLLAGYLGVLLISSATLALGLLCSALAPNQLVALILGAFLVGVFWLFWLISKVASPPLDDVLAYLSLHDKHFRPFMRGVISVQDVVYYVTLIYVALLSTTRVLESRRWQ